MSNIEKIKEQFAMKYMAGQLKYNDIYQLPINDNLKTFICSLGAEWAYYYACEVDKKPTDETREAACKDPWPAYKYALFVDKKPTKETREAACKDSCDAYRYALEVDKKPTDETREAACKDSYWEKQYQKFEREYNEQHRKD